MKMCKNCKHFVPLSKEEHPYYVEDEGVCYNLEHRGDLVDDQFYCNFWEKK